MNDHICVEYTEWVWDEDLKTFVKFCTICGKILAKA